jgi:putative oxidoreductase
MVRSILSIENQEGVSQMEYLPLVARICLGLFFFKTGVSHVFGFGETVEMMTNQGLPLANILLAGTVFFQILGGVSLLLGYQVKISSILLIIFLITASIVFHNPIVDWGQINDFLKNIGLINGLLMLIYTGSGALSID